MPFIGVADHLELDQTGKVWTTAKHRHERAQTPRETLLRPPSPCPLPSSPTLLEVFQIAELHQAVPIVVVGDIDPVICRSRVLHPGSLMAPVAMVSHGGVHSP